MLQLTCHSWPWKLVTPFYNCNWHTNFWYWGFWTLCQSCLSAWHYWCSRALPCIVMIMSFTSCCPQWPKLHVSSKSIAWISSSSTKAIIHFKVVEGPEQVVRIIFCFHFLFTSHREHRALAAAPWWLMADSTCKCCQHNCAVREWACKQRQILHHVVPSHDRIRGLQIRWSNSSKGNTAEACNTCAVQEQAIHLSHA